LARAGVFRRTAAPRPETGPPKLLQRVQSPHSAFARRRREMIEMINTYCDSVLCVSARVGEVAARYGVAPELITTSYIGTRHAEKFHQTSPRAAITRDDGTMTIAYLGYMRQDKGFYFLLDALEALPDAAAARITLVFGSKLSDHAAMHRLSELSDRFAALLFADGYAYDDLDTLLAEVDLGVIPVLWEDNLPQVAIEMHARHIPLLTSDLGGAQELGNCPGLVFKAGSTEDFAARISAVLKDEIDIEAYWQRAMTPFSMEDHLAELTQVYNRPARSIRMLQGRPPVPVPHIKLA